MAYLFNALSDEAGEQGKQNIFGGQQTDQGTTSGGAFDKGSAPSPSGGGGGAAPSGGPSGAQAQKAQSAYNPQAAGSAYQSAAQTIKMPTQALEKAEGSLAKGSQALQDQANAYSAKAGEAAKGYGLDEATLSGAAEGKGPEYQKTAQRLQGSAPLFEAFQAPEIENVQNIQDPGSLYRAESGPNYTAGQSRLDASFLRRNPEFVKRQQEILAKNAALQRESQERAKTETEKARGMLGTEYGTQTDAIRGRIGTMSDDVINAAKQKEIDEETRRAGIDPKEFAKKGTAEVLAMIEEDLKKADPRSEQGRALRFLKDEYDVSNLVDIDKDVDWREFIGDPEAQKYNRLQGLLGNADMLTPSAMGAGEGAVFDPTKKAYQTIMDQIKEKRQKADISDRERMAAIEAAATGRVSEGQKAARAQYEELLPQYQAMRNQAAGGGQENVGGFVFNQTGNVVLPEYQDQPLTWQDMLSAGEAEELNALQGDLGIMNATNYGAGTGNPYARNKQIQDELARYGRPAEPTGISIQPIGTGPGGGSSAAPGNQPIASEKNEKKKQKISGGT